MPQLWLLSLVHNVKLFELLNLFFQLDYEADLRGDTEVANAEETYRFKECKSVQFLLVPSDCNEVLQLQWSDLHDVANVERLDPLRLVEEAQNMPHISLSLFAFLSGGPRNHLKQVVFVHLILNGQVRVSCLIVPFTAKEFLIISLVLLSLKWLNDS